jgi:hypothetical protein
MAHFAKIGLNNIVLTVTKIDNFDIMDEDGVEQESIGVEFLKRMTGHETWVKCSFNTRGGIHYNDGQQQPDNKPQFRKNYPGVGWIYDSVKDAFIPPKDGVPSAFVLDEETCLYVAPVPKPEVADPNMLAWDNDNVQWIIKVQDGYFESGAPRYVMPE